MNTWKYIKSNVDRTDIGRFEKLTGLTFPQLIAEFILNHNNGRPRLNNVKMPSGEEHIFEKLLSFNQGDTENVFSAYNNLKTNLKSGSIPIAIDPFGNYFLLNAESNFQVEFWNHENGSTESTKKDLVSLTEALY